MFLLAALTLALSNPVYAQSCDAKGLAKTLGAARGDAVPPAYAALAACDAKAAKAQSKTALNNFKDGAAAGDMAVSVAKVGSYAELRAWLNAKPPETKEKVAGALAGACNADANVAGWYIDSAKIEKDKFWTNGTWQSLGSCHQPAIQTLLLSEIGKPAKDREMWFGIAEVYAQNAGGDSIGVLGAFLPALSDASEARRMLAVLGEAAKSGGPSAAAAAASAIEAAVPTLPRELLPDVRKQLESLGAQDAANRLALIYYKDALHSDGKLHYGVVAIEAANCKKGRKETRVHIGEGVDPIGQWPDQVAGSFRYLVKGNWPTTLAKECKGGGSTDVVVSPEPLSPGDLSAWQSEQVRKAKAVEVDKFEEVEEKVQLIPSK